MQQKTTDVQWLLDDLVRRVVGVRRAAVLSADGLLIARSRELSAEDGDHLAAVASAFQSLARGAAQHFAGGQVRQTLVEMDKAFLFVTAAGRDACLAAIASESVDVGMVAYEMNLLLARVGRYLSAQPRHLDVGAPPGPR